MKQSWKNLLPIVLSLSACFMLFQNFSLDNEYKDIRTIAPQGTLEEPSSPYLPDHTRATSLSALGNEIVKHNLNDEMKHFENQFEDWSGIEMGGRGPASVHPGAGHSQEPQTYRLRTGHLGKDKVGFRLQSDVDVKCEYSAFKNELLLSVDKTLGRNANLSFRHNTDDHKSSVNFSYSW